MSVNHAGNWLFPYDVQWEIALQNRRKWRSWRFKFREPFFGQYRRPDRGRRRTNILGYPWFVFCIQLTVFINERVFVKTSGCTDTSNPAFSYPRNGSSSSIAAVTYGTVTSFTLTSLVSHLYDKTKVNTDALAYILICLNKRRP